jgi:Protein of unknown function (DUF4012)
VLGILGLALIAVVILLVLALPPALSARRHLQEGRAAMEQGRAQLMAGDGADSVASFERADAEFSLAAEASRQLPLRVMGWIPVLGRTPDAITGLAVAGQDLADASAELARRVEELPGGLAGLAPSEGMVPVARYAEAGDAVGEAAAAVGLALDRLEETPGSLLLAPVREARREALDELGQADDSLRTASLMLSGLPGFLGADEPRQYFFGAQSPAELRGTGGLMGAYAILTVDRGRFSFSEFSPIQLLRDFDPSEVPAPSAEFSRIYDQYGGAGFWQNINMTPDFPSAGRAILGTYEEATGKKLDGVMMVDPFALRALLAETGPTRIPGLGVTVDEETVVPFISNRAYGLIEDPAERKLLLGTVAKTVVDRFLDGSSGSLESLRAVAETAAAGHLQVYSADSDLQRGLVRTTAGGSLVGGPGDFLAVVQNNAAGNKVDFYLDRSVSYVVQLESDGAASSQLKVELTNEAPTDGEPRYVIGPFPGVSMAGENIGIFHLYCAVTCLPQSLELDGKERELVVGTELGHPYLRDAIALPSGASAELDATWRLEEAWTGNDSRGVYRLSIIDQTTIQPTRYRVEVVTPEGTEVVAATPAMEVSGNRVVWEGTVGRRLDLEIRFQAPLPLRMWRDVVRVFTKPVIRL